MRLDQHWRSPATPRSFGFSRPPTLAKLAFVAAVVFVTAYTAIVLTHHSERIAVIWVANAFLLSVVARAPRESWPTYFLTGFLANLCANLATGDTLSFGAALATCNTAEVLVAALLVTRYFKGMLDLSHASALAKFALLTGGIAPAVSGILASIVFFFLTDEPALLVFETWFPADALGMLIIAPLLVMSRRKELLQLFRPPQVRETITVLGLVTVTAGLIFYQRQFPLLFLMTPIMTLTALRLRFVGAAIAVAIVALISVPLTVMAHGPLALVPGASLNERVLLVQIFLAVVVLTTLPLAAMFTTRRRLEIEAVEARRAAEQANAAKSTFLHTMSHELRTPMTGIMGMCHLLLAGEQSPGQRHITQVLERSARSFLELLNDILDIAKIEAGHVDVAAVQFKLSHVMRDVEELFAPAMAQKGLTLNIDTSSHICDALVGDARRLRQVLFNLVGNALKFTERGSVNVRRHLSLQDNGTVLVTLEVEDTGIGISDDGQRRLFRAFEQEDNSISRRFGGTGLGLYISHQLVTAMGGTIAAQSRQGQGSHFIVTLHLARGNAGEVTERSALAPAFKGTFLPGLALDVLLAEDNPTIQLLVSQMLEISGHAVTVAEDGRQAVTRASAKRYDIILMDMQMPILAGTEAVRLIRRGIGRSADAPIIALTADAILENRKLFLDAGCDAVVTKPIDWDELGRAVETLIGKRPATTVYPEEISEEPDEPPPLFDSSPIDEIYRDLGAERTRALLGQCMASMDQHLSEIRRWANAGDPINAKRAAHDLKGICAQFGAARASAIARHIELDVEDPQIIENIIIELAESLTHAEAKIQEIRSAL